MEHNYIFCEYCAKKNQTSYNFCTECGKSIKSKEAKIDTNQILPEKQPSKKLEEKNRSSIEILNNIFGFN